MTTCLSWPLVFETFSVSMLSTPAEFSQGPALSAKRVDGVNRFLLVSFFILLLCAWFLNRYLFIRINQSWTEFLPPRLKIILFPTYRFGTVHGADLSTPAFSLDLGVSFVHSPLLSLPTLSWP
jgi:hypothetical protein